jgi:hypothetical protein
MQIFTPGCHCAIDEGMVKFKGRSSMKQFLPKKPTKRGFKIWTRAYSLSGFMNKFEVYEGKKGDRTEVGLGAIVVTSLTKKIQNHYHQVYFDNYFTSIDLLVKLLRNGIYSCGTFREKIGKVFLSR